MRNITFILYIFIENTNTKYIYKNLKKLYEECFCISIKTSGQEKLVLERRDDYGK
jgi:hypothetical protein